MAPIDFTNGQNTIRRVVWGCINTWKINTNMKDNTWNIIFNIITQETVAEFGG